MNILFFGDIMGKPGRRALAQALPALRREYSADVVIANTENLAHGKGVTMSTIKELVDMGVDIGTGGNHSFAKPESLDVYAQEPNILVRPENLPGQLPGQGRKVFTVSQKKLLVINLLGQRGMMPDVLNPFPIADDLLRDIPDDLDGIVVDFHAEATSEKVNMGWHLDGRASLVVGTHTHVPTADERILPGGTAYITDLGMVGLRDSSLGINKDITLQRFLTGAKGTFDIADHGLVAINGIAVSITDRRATTITRIYREITI